VIQKVGYGLGTVIDMWGHWLYPSLAYLVFNITLGVPPQWIGRAMLFKLIFEAVWDSYFGWRSDNTRTKYGRRRPYILVGGILSGIGLPLVFAVTPGWGDTTIAGMVVPNYFWFMISTLALYVPIISCFNMPFQSLGAELTPDYHERTSVFSYKSAIQKVPEVAMFAAGAFATAGWAQGRAQDPATAWGKIAGVDQRYLYGAGLALAGAFLSALFPPLGMLALGGAGALGGSAAADKRAEKAAETGKPDDVQAKMVDGAVKKFAKENALLSQVFVMDNKTVISDLIAQAGKAAGTPIVLKDYARFQLGEGIEKEEVDFAAEVAATLKG
jgi:hypothetical protein